MEREFTFEYYGSIAPVTEEVRDIYTVEGGKRIHLKKVVVKAVSTTNGNLMGSIHHGMMHITPSNSEAFIDVEPEEFPADELFKEHGAVRLHIKNVHKTETYSFYVKLTGVYK